LTLYVPAPRRVTALAGRRSFL